MENHKPVRFTELIEYLEGKDAQPVFADDHFERRTVNTKLDPETTLNVIADSLKNADIKCYHISITLLEDKLLEIEFGQSDHVLSKQGRMISSHKTKKLYWIPRDPVLRKYDDYGRIEVQKRSDFESKAGAGGLCLSVSGKADSVVEFCVLTFTKDIEFFTKEICESSPLETKKIMRSNWFYYEGLSDVWKYFVNGKVYNIEPLFRRKSEESQNITFALYHYLYYLHSQTQKSIYLELCDLIAYSLMLSLPQDSRFRHGSWTELMETHTVYQVSAIDVLLSFFERTRREVFLQKAKCAMDYLVSLADKLNDGSIWFMHDTLEDNLEDASLYYGKLVSSKAFGKSEANTLCFNSHIWALMALYRLNQLAPSAEYQQLFESGMAALKRVLQAKPCSVLYYAIYKLWDVIVSLDLKYENRLTKKALKIYTILLRRHILPKLKKLFPRFVMPNGFLERDLTYSVLSVNYHFVNLRDLLMLYEQTREKWIKEIVVKSVDYTCQCDIVKYFGLKNPKSLKIFDILLSYSSLIDPHALSSLRDYISIFGENHFSLTMDVLSNPFIADICLRLNVSDDDIAVLIPSYNELITAVLINLTLEDKEVCLNTDINSEEFEFVDSDGGRSDFKNQITVPGSGYIKIVRKSVDYR
jgi:D-glucuronyl C5-epimerase-like protein